MASTALQMSAGRIGVARRRVLFLGLLLLTMSRGTAGATGSSPVSGTAASTVIGTSAPPAASTFSGAPVSNAPRGPSTAAAGGALTSLGGTSAAASPRAASAGSMAAPNTGSVSPTAATPASAATWSPNGGSGMSPTVMTMSSAATWSPNGGSGMSPTVMTMSSAATWSPNGGSGMPPTVMTMSSAAMSTATRAMSSASWRPESGSGTANPTTTTAAAMMSTSAGSTSGLSSSSTAWLFASTAAGPKSGSTASVATSPATWTSRSPNTGSGHPAMMSMTPTPGGSAAGATMMTTPPMDVVYCPVLSCNSSQCQAAYASQNATPCAAGQWCQLWKMESTYYAANCSASCGGECADAAQAPCAVACCNATGCLADTFASLDATTSAAPAPSAASVTVPMTATPTRRATTANGRKCHRGTCTGATCYTGFRDTLQTCSASQPHCQLIKQTVQSATQWTAGCAANCSGQTPCRAAAPPPCHLECCVAVVQASCLWLNGTLNHVAARATGATASPLALCLLLALGLLM